MILRAIRLLLAITAHFTVRAELRRSMNRPKVFAPRANDPCLTTLVKPLDKTAGFDLTQQAVIDKRLGISSFGFWIIFLHKSKHRLNAPERWIGRNLVELCRHEIVRSFEVALLRAGDPELLRQHFEAFALMLFEVGDALDESSEES